MDEWNVGLVTDIPTAEYLSAWQVLGNLEIAEVLREYVASSPQREQICLFLSSWLGISKWTQVPDFSVAYAKSTVSHRIDFLNVRNAKNASKPWWQRTHKNWIWWWSILIYISLWINCLFEIRKVAVFPLAFIAGWLQGHWWGFISRNYIVWPTFLLMNVFIALKGSHFWFLFDFTAAGVVPCGSRKTSPRTSTIVQFIFYFGPLRSAIILWEIRNKWLV